MTSRRRRAFDVALCVERLHERTRLRVRRITATWAGLRTFAPDRLPVLGPDPADESFGWCAGLGGFGIMAAQVLPRRSGAGNVTEVPR